MFVLCRSAPQLMKESLTALFFLRCLQKKNYFDSSCKKSTGSSLSEDELFIAMLIHHFMRVVFYNSHEVFDLQHYKKYTILKNLWEQYRFLKFLHLIWWLFDIIQTNVVNINFGMIFLIILLGYGIIPRSRKLELQKGLAYSYVKSMKDCIDLGC